MSRKKAAQVRLGKKEAAQLRLLLKKIKTYKVFLNQKKLSETKLNALLINHLKQSQLGVENKRIKVAKFVGEIFRPECFLDGDGQYPVCAIECKKLNDQFAKRRWKEGLSQCLLYAQYYKAVIYVLYDFSSGTRYAKAFGAGNRIESRFATTLRKHSNIYLITLTPFN